MDEKSLDNLRLDLAFNNVIYLIENKNTNLSRSSKVYIGWAKQYFQNATKSIDSMLSLESSESYFITPHLLEIIKHFKENVNSDSIQKAKSIRTEFNYIIKSLDSLKENPEKFYTTENSQIILNHFNNFVEVVANQ